MEDYWYSNKNRTRNKIHSPCCLLLVLNLSGCLSIYVSIYLSILGQEVLHLVSLQESHSIPCRRLCLQCGDTLCSSFFFFLPFVHYAEDRGIVFSDGTSTQGYPFWVNYGHCLTAFWMPFPFAKCNLWRCWEFCVWKGAAPRQWNAGALGVLWQKATWSTLVLCT